MLPESDVDPMSCDGSCNAMCCLLMACHSPVLVPAHGQVYGVDVGHGQVMGSIAQDPRVTVMERTNLRYLEPSQLPEQVGRLCGSSWWQLVLQAG